ncbi:MAG: 50S ribosomal protein L15 [Ezakiella sp.]|nr:50S ribosomal protein L15 [Ezakiella sp.]MDD7472373.1 50S ribosomal protein L15 [Bacillota bacterium]MDY3923107.1 50S ribosomal protein L15 [Ezakiella sp.]
MELQNLKGLERTKKKRVGRGIGSGMGKTSTRGMKGQNSRSGGGVRPGFEGGQMPLFRRMPKRGFTNIWSTKYSIVNVGELDVFDNGDVVDLNSLIEKGIVRRNAENVKILGDGEINKKLSVKANKISKSAKEKIEKAGGTAEVL